MGLDECLASQQIRELFRSRKIITSSFDESRIQPASFDPVVADELFIIDTESGMFRPNSRETIYKTLLQLPKRRRQKISTVKGFELKKGFTYLIPLEERVALDKEMSVRSSPKSSCGRLFLDTRLIADYNVRFDEIGAAAQQEALQLWLMVQPLAFNLVLRPSISLNQLRFMNGYGAKLTPQQLSEELKKNPILYKTNDEGIVVPSEAFISEGLEVHLDLSGRGTQGIVGLRARHNPIAIDMGERAKYEAEDYFEPVKLDGSASIESGEYYLFSSIELLKIPEDLSVELRAHHHAGIRGPIHFAGFVDNGFQGDLVFEVRSDEVAKRVELVDGMPVSVLDVFKTGIPDKLYGEKIGSNYQGQIGPRPSKNFKPFDFGHAARNYRKLDRSVLVQDAGILRRHRSSEEGFVLASPEEVQKLYEDIRRGFFHSRYDCEDDELALQIIPYTLIFGPGDTVFSYLRAENIKDYGDKRLFGKHSIGLGGHITHEDAPGYIEKCLERELTEEVFVLGELSKPKLAGTIFSREKPVDRTHFGLVFLVNTSGQARPKEGSIQAGLMERIGMLVSGNHKLRGYETETWSRLLIPNLPELYRLSTA